MDIFVLQKLGFCGPAPLGWVDTNSLPTHVRSSRPIL